MQQKIIKWLGLPLMLSALTLTGCTKKPSSPNDPLEKYNRVMFDVNMTVDRYGIRPVAQVYNAIVPGVLQTGIANVWDNVNTIPTMPNDLLQGNFKYIFIDFWRLAINTTLGLGGLFDVASRVGLPKHVETFGLTLAKWRGGKSSPYFMIPFFGPSTIQNSLGFAADYYMTPWPYLKHQEANYIFHGIVMMNARSRLLPSDKLLGTAFDPYVFVRDAYMQKQTQAIAENEALYKK